MYSILSFIARGITHRKAVPKNETDDFGTRLSDVRSYEARSRADARAETCALWSTLTPTLTSETTALYRCHATALQPCRRVLAFSSTRTSCARLPDTHNYVSRARADVRVDVHADANADADADADAAQMTLIDTGGF